MEQPLTFDYFIKNKLVEKYVIENKITYNLRIIEFNMDQLYTHS